MSYAVVINPVITKDMRTGNEQQSLLICDDYVSLYIKDERFRNMPEDDVQLVKMIIDYMMESTTIDNDHIWGEEFIKFKENEWKIQAEGVQ